VANHSYIPELYAKDIKFMLHEKLASVDNLSDDSRKNINQSSAMLNSIIENTELILVNAEEKSQIRSSLPQRLNILFYFEKILLKIYNFIFKEQRSINFSLIQALRQSLDVNKVLINDLYTLGAKVDSIEEQLKLTKEKLIPTEFSHNLDDFYVALEDVFRGSRDNIKNRLKVYLSFLEESKIGTKEFPILDLACGRGEWLELVKENGYVSKGIDINRVMVDQCRSRKLDVVESDLTDYIQSLPDESIGMVTGFHIIEHLSLETLIELFANTYRVLKFGGVAIFETPNPQNVLVGSCTFYMDPTHKNPIPSQTAKFILEYSNFSNVNILNLNSLAGTEILGDLEIERRFNQYFYSPMDYSVIGYKIKK
jgi:SAM-dependent methyltransferase